MCMCNDVSVSLLQCGSEGEGKSNGLSLIPWYPRGGERSNLCQFSELASDPYKCVSTHLYTTHIVNVFKISTSLIIT